MERPTIIEAKESEEFFRPAFREKDIKNKTWQGWDTFLKTLYALEMSEEEKSLYFECTGRTETPKKAFKEAYCICGRRGGKSFISALIAVYSAIFGNWEQYLTKGETAYVFCIATDREQAKVVLDYARGLLSLFPDIVEKELTWSIHLKNRVNIAVKTCSYRGTRGFTTAVIILDELAHFKDERSANPAEEVVYSLEPGLLEEGLLIGISTTHRRWGYLYNVWKNHFGKEDSDTLIWVAPTLRMNPTYSEKKINRFMKRDVSAARSEYFCEWREDIEAFLTEAMLDAVIDHSITYNLPEPGVRYSAFVDVSGGRQDSFAMTIGHREGELIIVDLLSCVDAPVSDPEVVIGQFCDTLKEYKVSQVVGDAYAAEFVSSAFRKQGVIYRASELDKSELYINFQPLIATQRVLLPNNEKLKTQFLQLERRPRSGGKDIVDHPQGLHDDLANACAGVCVGLYKEIAHRLTPNEIQARLPHLVEPRPAEFLSHRRVMREEVEKLRKDMRGKPQELKEGDLGFVYTREILKKMREKEAERKKKREKFPEVENASIYGKKLK